MHPLHFRDENNEIPAVEEEMTCNQFTLHNLSTLQFKGHTVHKKMKNGTQNQKKRWTIFSDQRMLERRKLLRLRLLQLKIGKALK